MNEAVMALDSTKFSWFDSTIITIQRSPTLFGKEHVLEFYPVIVQFALNNEGKYLGKERIEVVQEIHNEYLEIIAAFNAERGEQHEAPSVNTNGQTNCEASGGSEQNANLAL